MISTEICFSCDVEGCDRTEKMKDPSLVGFMGVPHGWATVAWFAEVKPGTNEPLSRIARAFKKLKPKMPPEMVEYSEASLALIGGGENSLPPRMVPCKAVICNGCLNKINLGDFDAGV